VNHVHVALGLQDEADFIARSRFIYLAGVHYSLVRSRTGRFRPWERPTRVARLWTIAEDPMRGFIGLLVVLVGLVLCVAPAWADDKKAADKEKTKKIDVDKVPKKVMAAVKARFPKAKITSVEKETSDGKVMYDIELTQKGRKY